MAKHSSAPLSNTDILRTAWKTYSSNIGACLSCQFIVTAINILLGMPKLFFTMSSWGSSAYSFASIILAAPFTYGLTRCYWHIWLGAHASCTEVFDDLKDKHRLTRAVVYSMTWTLLSIAYTFAGVAFTALGSLTNSPVVAVICGIAALVFLFWLLFRLQSFMYYAISEPSLYFTEVVKKSFAITRHRVGRVVLIMLFNFLLYGASMFIASSIAGRNTMSITYLLLSNLFALFINPFTQLVSIGLSSELDRQYGGKSNTLR